MEKEKNLETFKRSSAKLYDPCPCECGWPVPGQSMTTGVQTQRVHRPVHPSCSFGPALQKCQLSQPMTDWTFTTQSPWDILSSPSLLPWESMTFQNPVKLQGLCRTPDTVMVSPIPDPLPGPRGSSTVSSRLSKEAGPHFGIHRTVSWSQSQKCPCRM